MADFIVPLSAAVIILGTVGWLLWLRKRAP